MENRFLKLASERYSCRSYTSESVSETDLATILEAALIAPSACNRQPWRLKVVRSGDEEASAAVAASYSREWVRTAPMYIIVCKVPAEAWVRPFDNHNHADVDIAILSEHICLAATSLGLGTCWICNFDPAVLSERLSLPEGIVPSVIIPVGHPADTEPEKKRKSLAEILL